MFVEAKPTVYSQNVFCANADLFAPIVVPVFDFAGLVINHKIKQRRVYNISKYEIKQTF